MCEEKWWEERLAGGPCSAAAVDVVVIQFHCDAACFTIHFIETTGFMRSILDAPYLLDGAFKFLRKEASWIVRVPPIRPTGTAFPLAARDQMLGASVLVIGSLAVLTRHLVDK